ncbi:MAG: PAS domain S-box protein [Archangiaceae bacterium]|nr:PAS domain S-box protein [Archangiaceae bacterium]
MAQQSASQRLVEQQGRVLKLWQERMAPPRPDARPVLPMLEALTRALGARRSVQVTDAGHPLGRAQGALDGLKSVDVFQGIVLEVLEEEGALASDERALVLQSFHAFRLALAEAAQRREHALTEAVAKSEERYVVAVRAAGFTIWDWDLTERRIHWSYSVEAMLGHPVDALSSIGMWLEHVHPLDRERVGEGLRSAVEEGRTGWTDAFQFLKRDGSWAGVIGRAWIMHDHAGNAVRVVGGLVDVTEQRSLERKLAEQVQLTRTVAENATSGLFLLDGRGHATYLNPAASAITGYALEHLQGQPLHGRVHSHAALHRPAAVVRDQECTFTRRDGTQFVASCSAMPLAEYDLGGSVLEFRDVTELKRAELQLREAVQARDEFISIASHELRTPLTALQLQIQGMTRGPLAGGVDERVKKRLLGAERSVSRMVQLVNELLDVTRVEAGRLELEVEEVNLSELVRELVDRLQTEIRQAGSAVTVEAPERAMGRWDRRRLDQVIGNLLTNALKYGEGKPVRVRVEVDGEQVRLQVRDQGIGIAPSQHARIFARFERAVSSRHYGGFGVGLWIVHRVVEAMGGAIRLESAVGQGSTFEVTLPVSAPGAPR